MKRSQNPLFEDGFRVDLEGDCVDVALFVNALVCKCSDFVGWVLVASLLGNSVIVDFVVVGVLEGVKVGADDCEENPVVGETVGLGEGDIDGSLEGLIVGANDG